jgi:carbonic anhydrase
MKKIICLAFASILLMSCPIVYAEESTHEPAAKTEHGSAGAQQSKGVNADEALERLLAGNKRYVEGQFFHPHQAAQDRANVATSQHPFAIIVSCSDSRIPPEVIFDQGIGDIFVVRVAGNIAGNIELGSIEYAAEHLGSTLVMVLGHERCGAVTAAVKGGEVPGHIKSIVEAIIPAVKLAAADADKVDGAIRANVSLVATQIKTSEPILAEMAKEGKIKIVGAYYDLDTGEISVINAVAAKAETKK